MSGEEQFECGRDVDDVLDEAADGRVAFGGDGDDAAGARGDFLNVGEGLLVAQLRGGVGFVARGEHDDGEGLVDEGVGAVLHFAGGVAFGVNVGDFLELERAFEGDGEMDAAAEVEEVARVGEAGGELLALCGAGLEHFFDLGGNAAELFDELRRTVRRRGGRGAGRA